MNNFWLINIVLLSWFIFLNYLNSKIVVLTKNSQYSLFLIFINTIILFSKFERDIF